MARQWKWLGLGIGAYLTFCLITFPAGTAYRWFTPAELRLAGIQGTIWRGSAAIGSIGNLGIQDIEWRIRPWSLLTAAIEGHVELRRPDSFLSADIRIGPTAFEASQVQATTTLATLAALLPLGDVQGLVSVRLAELELENGWPVRAVGEVRLADLEVPVLAAGGSGDLIPLGGYRITLNTGTGSALEGLFEDQGGPLQVAGSIQLLADRSYEISGLVQPRAEAPRELVQALDFFAGSPDTSGRRPFGLSGNL
jgi:hypothetical protein